MDYEKRIDIAMDPLIDFPHMEWCYHQAMSNQKELDAIITKYQAMKAKSDDYKAQCAAAKDEAAVEAILGTLTRE